MTKMLYIPYFFTILCYNVISNFFRGDTMKEKWLYDMTDAENAMKSLSKFLNIGKRELFRFIFTRTNEEIDYDKFYEELIEEFEIEIDKVSIDNIEIKSIHVTTGSDNGYSIREKGLLNLQEVLIQDTPLRNFLLKRDIRIDVENKLVYFRDQKLLIVDDTSGHEDNKNYVFVDADGLIDKVEITLGEEEGEYVIVTSGLKENDMVMKNPTSETKEGNKSE